MPVEGDFCMSWVRIFGKPLDDWYVDVANLDIRAGDGDLRKDGGGASSKSGMTRCAWGAGRIGFRMGACCGNLPRVGDVGLLRGGRGGRG